MYWKSFSEFLAMGNHGLYVWGSFIVMLLAMAVEPLLLVMARRNLFARLQRQFRADKAEAAARRVNEGELP